MNVIDVLVNSPVASGAGAVVVAVTAGIIIRSWQRRKEAGDEVKQWYRDALGLVGRLQQVGHRTTAYQQADYPTLRENLGPLAEEMQEHGTSAPEGVEEEARVELVYLAAFSTGLITLSEQAEEFDTEEFFEQVQEHAKETYDGERDIGEVNDLIEPIDTDAVAEEMDRDVETDDEAIDEFLGHFTDESLEAGQPTSIEEALEMPIGMIDEVVEEENFWDEMLGDTMRKFIKLILLDVSEDVFKAMERRKQET